MNANRNIKVSHQRNVTPSFVPLKRTPPNTQANPPPRVPKKTKDWTITNPPIAATPRPVEVASTSTKNGSCISANLVP